MYQLRLENSIEVAGTTHKSEKAPGGIEVEVSDIKIEGQVYYDKLPFEVQSYKQKVSLETQLRNSAGLQDNIIKKP